MADETSGESASRPSITCPVCGKTSYHPGDIENKYCGYCKWWTGDTERLAQWIEYHAIARPVSDRQPLHPAVLDAIVHLLQG